MGDKDTARYSGFDALMERHQELVRTLCWWHAGGDTERTADLVQEVMMSLWHYRHTLRSGASAGEERQWVRWHCRSVFSHLRRKGDVETVPLEEAPEVADDDRSGRDLIDRLADGLNDRERQMLELVLDGYTDGEAATALGVTEAEARRLHATVIEKMKRNAKRMDL